MGQNESKDASLHILNFVLKDGGGTMILNFNEDFNLGPCPNSERVEEQFQEVIQNFVLQEDSREHLASFELVTKWKLISKYNDIIWKRKKNKQVQEILLTEARQKVQTLRKDPSIHQLTLLKIWLDESAKNDDIKEFIIYEGGCLLFDLLNHTERLHRG